MGLEDQAAVKRVADEHGNGVVVLLGTPDAESTQTLAQTVVAGDPSYAGPLAGVPLGLPVLHVFEPDGTERPGWPQWLGYPSTLTNVAIADLDRDGRSEVVVLNYSNLYVFRADGIPFGPGWPRYESTNNGFGGLFHHVPDG